MTEGATPSEQLRAKRVERVDNLLQTLFHGENLSVEIQEQIQLQRTFGIDEGLRRTQQYISADLPSLTTVSPSIQDMVIGKLRELAEFALENSIFRGRRNPTPLKRTIISYYALEENAATIPSFTQIGKDIGVGGSRVTQHRDDAIRIINMAIMTDEEAGAKWREIKGLLNPPIGIEPPQTPTA